ncbi:MAG TPA: DNA-processing protein DprA [Candidatus Rubrimentiphilum sp.]|nr:DNA-processing protein DprA [Candidatus Rubrimentiphilum sp.]
MIEALVDKPTWQPRPAFEALRAPRALPAVFDGLWVSGDLSGLKVPCVAIVGTRAASEYGRSNARRFARDLGASGCCIISGLALGIDAAAHEGALDVRAPTVGVLGGGHDRFFPRRNRALADRIVADAGAVLSPFAPEHPAIPHQFLQRNGVVAALADAVVVIEAPARSGALNTAGWAAGRVPVFAVPGDIDRPHSAGCHALIRDGVTLARSAQDVLDELQIMKLPLGEQSKRFAPSDPLQAQVLAMLQHGETTFDELCAAVEGSTADLFAALSLLELQGAIEARAGQRYASVSDGRRC